MTQESTILSWVRYRDESIARDPHGISQESREVDDAMVSGAWGYHDYGKAIKVAKRYGFSLPQMAVERQAEIGKMKAEYKEAGKPWPPVLKSEKWTPEEGGRTYTLLYYEDQDLGERKAKILEERQGRANQEVSRLLFQRRELDGRITHHRLDGQGNELTNEAMNTWGIHFYDSQGDPAFRLEPRVE